MSAVTDRYFIVHKPYDMVSQFISTHNVRLLGDLDFDFPEGTHAVGRLDKNSEGLLILTTNKKVTRQLFQSAIPHKRTYLVQIKNTISEDAINQLRTGLRIRIKGDEEYVTTPCEVFKINDEEIIKPFLKSDKNIYGPWLSITLTEGKYHQVRKMIAAVRHRCKRLIRVSIDQLHLGDLAAGCVREIEEEDFYLKIKIGY